MQLERDWDPGVYAGQAGGQAHSRLQIYRHPDRPTVVLATEQSGHADASIIETIETLAMVVCREFGITLDSLFWIEHYLAADALAGRFAHVDFARNAEGKFAATACVLLSTSRVEALIGSALGC